MRQHSLPEKQLSGSIVQSRTRHVRETTTSQKLASMPAQSASAAHVKPVPDGGLWQYPGAASVLQA
jgi:hypothetical protein